jgi:lambda repressor-like predicted transcriptional regulator
VDGISTVQFSATGIGAVGLSAIQSGPMRGHPAMDAAAKVLGMSTGDLRTAIQSGGSLATIASSKGISQATLTAAMTAAIQQANPEISADQAAKVATAMVNRTPPAGGPPPDGGAGAAGSTGGTSGTTATHGHHGHHHHAGAASMDAAAQALGMSATDLMSSLGNGTSLASIAKSKGVSQDDLVKAMATALQGADTNLTADQASQLATRMATQTSGTQNGAWAAAAQQAAPSTFSITA